MKIILNKIYLMIFLSVILTGCNVITYFQQDPFYREGSEYDSLRFPLIKPYYAIYLNDEYGWDIPLETDPASRDFYYYLTLHDVRKIAIEQGVIMIYTPFEEHVAESVGQKVLYWFVFVPGQQIEMGFDNEADFLTYTQQFGIGEPSWREPIDILQEYDQTWCLDWIPACK